MSLRLHPGSPTKFPPGHRSEESADRKQSAGETGRMSIPQVREDVYR